MSGDGAEARRVVLTFDDACHSHREYVAPLLLRHGFGATFFVCRFDDEWRAKNGAALMTAAEIKELQAMGFRVGNHTWAHGNFGGLSPEAVEAEVVRLNGWLAEAGIAAPESFAYPGGPYVAAAVPALRRQGVRLARAVEQRPWEPRRDDPFRIPSCPLQGDDWQAFLAALAGCAPGKVPVLVFHGVPDRVHPWVDTSPEFFAACMRHLADGGYTVTSLEDCAHAFAAPQE